MAIQRALQLLIEDAFVRRVHVDDDQPLRVLSKDEDAVQLSQRVAILGVEPID